VAERIPVRRDFFLHIFGVCHKTLPEIFQGASLDEQDATYLSGLFFLISDAYKKFRMPENHFTNDDKKAGISIASAMALRPIQFPNRLEDEISRFYSNQIFGMACAEAILDQPLDLMPNNEKILFYNWLETIRFPCTEQFIVDATEGSNLLINSSLIRVTYPEITQIDMIIHRLRDIYTKIELERRLLNIEKGRNAE
jgi:hypothetical protein